MDAYHVVIVILKTAIIVLQEAAVLQIVSVVITIFKLLL